MRQHPTVAVAAPDGSTVDIDTDIASLLTALWSRGVETCQSCQESMPGMVWIAFERPESAIAFLESVGLNNGAVAAADFDDYDSLTVRALNPEIASPGGAGGPLSSWEWRWSALPMLETGTFAIAVDFPRADLPELMRRLS
ncbi:MAG: hypothetical protein ACR2LK_02605 [Solirubrobacteraceae bacterium]